VQILVDIAQAPDGRLSGAAAIAGSDDAFPFSGKLELLNRIEELCRLHLQPDGQTPIPDHERSV